MIGQLGLRKFFTELSAFQNKFKNVHVVIYSLLEEDELKIIYSNNRHKFSDFLSSIFLFQVF